MIKETDADQAKMVEAVRSFGAELKQRGVVGLFYFSGHGTQIDGENYLLPVGREFSSLEDVKRGSVTALAVVDAMATGRSDLNIIILDACATIQSTRTGRRGSRASIRMRGCSSPEGTVEIERQGKAYHLSWEVGSSSYEGNGVLAGNLLTMEWGSRRRWSMLWAPTAVSRGFGTRARARKL